LTGYDKNEYFPRTGQIISCSLNPILQIDMDNCDIQVQLKNMIWPHIGFNNIETFHQLNLNYKNYEEFMQYQYDVINNLSFEELHHLINYIRATLYFKPRHVDVENYSQHYIIKGFYFELNGKLMTFSTYD
jgi:histidinol phosphatase-like PHP family hydrolase